MPESSFGAGIGKIAKEIQGKPLEASRPQEVKLGGKTIQLPGTLPNYAPGYTPAPRDPADAPNYEKLTGYERWVMGKLPGFSQGAVGKALDWFGKSPLGKALSYLDVGAEALAADAVIDAAVGELEQLLS